VQVSLVIPLRNEEASVPALLESIDRQTRPPDQVVVVDAGSTDGTLEMLRRRPAGSPLTVLERSELYPGTARNVGVEAARHEWVAFTDGGVRLEPDWLEILCRVALSTQADVVLGNYHPVCDSDFRKAAAVAYVARLGTGGLRGPFVASMLVRKTALEAAGGFPGYRAAEDLILLERLLRPPRRIAEAPDAGIHWQLPAGPRALFRRFDLYSYHNLLAGRGRGWHWGVARLYMLLAVAAFATTHLAGGLYALLLLPGFFFARAAKAAWLKRRSFDFPSLRIGRVARAAALLAVIDAATLTGAMRLLLERPPRN
jgi:glycosyltransferase involved in cell wall biosynthesis